MSNNKKTFYFPHDYNARNDEKILAVRMKYGWEGYGIYFALIEKLGESTDYVLVKDYNILAFDMRISSEKIKSIIEDFGLFDFTDCGKFIYSKSLTNRMIPLEEIREKRREAGRKGAEKRWEQPTEDGENGKPMASAMQKDGRVEESKVKKSKALTKEEKDMIDELYKLYPSKCIVKGSSTGKSKKHKDKVAVLFKELGYDILSDTIKWYVEDCKLHKRFMLNFSTFLNNLPEIPEDYKGASTPTKLIRWVCEAIGLDRKGTHEQYQADVKRNAPHEVKIIGDVK